MMMTMIGNRSDELKKMNDDTNNTPDQLNEKGANFEKGINNFPKNPARAFACFKRAAEMGSAEAMKNLGLCHKNAIGTKQDYNAAFAWFEKSAGLGNAAGMLNVGWCFKSGFGVEKDLKRDVEFFQKSADMNEPTGMLHLGLCLDKGTGIERNHERALEWFRKAASMGQMMAQQLLAGK